MKNIFIQYNKAETQRCSKKTRNPAEKHKIKLRYMIQILFFCKKTNILYNYGD